MNDLGLRRLRYIVHNGQTHHHHHHHYHHKQQSAVALHRNFYRWYLSAQENGMDVGTASSSNKVS